MRGASVRVFDFQPSIAPTCASESDNRIVSRRCRRISDFRIQDHLLILTVIPGHDRREPGSNSRLIDPFGSQDPAYERAVWECGELNSGSGSVIVMRRGGQADSAERSESVRCRVESYPQIQEEPFRQTLISTCHPVVRNDSL